MASGRYSSPYRGRRGGSWVLKVLILLLVILLAAGVLFYFFLGNYIQYTDDGVRLVLPWSEKAPVEEAPPVVSDMVVEEPEETVSVPPVEEVPLRRLEAVEVSPDEVMAGAADEKVKTAGGNALVVRVKTVEGHLAWDSRAELAVAAELTGSEDFRAAVAALAEADELYLVARMNVFQDLWMCVHDKSMALTTAAGKLWYDTYGMPWLSPANAEAWQYVVQLCLELAEMGFDEILMEYAGFPAKGKLSAVAAGVNYPASGRDAVMSQWMGELTGALEGTGVRLSVRVKEGELAQTEGASGWTAESLALADRIWMESGADLNEDTLTLEQAGMEDARRHLVQIWPQVPEDRSESWAVLF